MLSPAEEWRMRLAGGVGVQGFGGFGIRVFRLFLLVGFF
jgi:hypothetical protein